MIRWTATSPTSSPDRQQSPAEILKSESALNDELVRLQLAHYLLRFEWEQIKREYYDRKAGFNPNQPRVPAGNPDGGQWTSEGANSVGTLLAIPVGEPAAYLLAASGKQSAAYCWNQMQIDMLYCSTLRRPSLVAACRSQAMERYAACLTGKPLPPLPF